LKRDFGLSQEGYPITLLQGFSNTIDRIGWDVKGPNATDVIFGVGGVFIDRVGVDVGSRDGDRCLDRDSDGFLWKSEGEGLINRCWRGDGGRGDEGDRDGRVDSVGHDYG